MACFCSVSLSTLFCTGSTPVRRLKTANVIFGFHIFYFGVWTAKKRVNTRFSWRTSFSFAIDVLLRPNGCILQKYYFKLFAISVSYIYWSLFKFILSHREIMKNKYVKGCTQLYSQHLKSHHIKLTQNSIIYQPFVPTDNHIILQWLK